MNQGLDHLSERCGVFSEYRDIWGSAHPTSDAAKRAVLLAMGVPAETDEQIAAAHLALDRRAWQSPLPPVQVDREASPHRVTLALPVGEEGQTYRWRLLREAGGEEQGEFTPAALEEAGRCQLDGQDLVRRVIVLDLAVEPGYHRLLVERADRAGASGEMSFIVAPATCYEPPAIQGEGRVWGFAAQLYGIRSERNWGIGDFGDLIRMLEFCADAGADLVMLNPLHALFPNDAERACPYSPSSRACFNPLYLDVEAIPDFSECDEAKAMVQAAPFQAALRALRSAQQVDYRGVADLKTKLFERLYRHFHTRHLDGGTERARAFRAFQADHGERLRGQALFDALQEHFPGESAAWGWPAWPEAYRDRSGPEVAAFLADHLERVEYYEYLQWQVDRQLAAAGTRSWDLGLGLGVILDLAVGVAEGGAATWTRGPLFAHGASAGAPPDQINLLGQDWGLPPWIPRQLTAAAYRPFIELLRIQMAHSGALRMDHVMGLCRLFWVARGLPIAEGAYVAYPFQDLLGILALESQRNQCLVLGEDLGTVPDEVRQALQPAGVLSTRLLSFERRDDGKLNPPKVYPAQAAAAVTTHDLPTLAGFWLGLDIDLRTALHLFPSDAVRDQQILGRAQDRVQLLLALEGEGLVPAGSSLHPGDFPALTEELAAAVYTYLGRTPSKLVLIQLEDGFGGREQANLPGCVAPAYPCWRLKQPLNLEEWHTSTYLEGILQALRQERPAHREPRPGPPGGAGPEGVRSWIPRATYRLQMNRDFPLRQATALLPYLDDLGISHCYLSPLLKARPGSSHGYDITDHASLNPEITSAEEFDQFAAALKERGMGQIMDMVPNHMGIMGDDNRWWLDVLENGPASKFAAYFDIDWHPLAEELWLRVLLPVLGDTYGATLERGELRLAFDPEQGSFSVFYGEHRLPVDPREYPRILGQGLARLKPRMGAENPALLEFQSLITAFGHLPARDQVTPEAVAERGRDKEVHKRHLAVLCAANPDLAQFVTENVAECNGAPPSAAGVDLLHALLEAQAYRLAFWRVAADEINYRRFFDINNLAALNMDHPEVFESTHRLVRELMARGCLNGLRIDHPDGLSDPKQYFERLQSMAAALTPAQDGVLPLYLVAEKILAVHEHLPESWPVHGTTGYDFAAASDGLFVDPAGEAPLTHIYNGFIRARRNQRERVRANKHLIMETLLAGEWQVLATRLTRLAKGDRSTRDFTFNSLRGALAEIVASFPVYRTYVAGLEPPSRDDVRYVEWAVGVAKKASLAVDTSIFDFVRDALLVRLGQGKSEAYRKAVAAFAAKFQQYSAPVMAKAVEDTTFYQFNRLVSLNEVGSDPYRFGVSPAAFHQENQERARRWPHTLLAGSTHDSKRSEDVRARVSALSEMPEDWSRAISRWSLLTRGSRRELGRERAPSPNDEYLLYQTLLGVWPFAEPDAQGLADLAERVEAYMLKAGREAKLRSSWIQPQTEYEEATRDFVRALLAPGPGNRFLQDFLPFQRRVARAGAFTSLAQQLLKLTAPGVPDFYQGSEGWDFSLADPDNRRAVDYGALRAALDGIQAAHHDQGAAACARELLEHLPDGRIKLYLIWKTLAFRRGQEALFRDGAYLPLKLGGARADHALAFARRKAGQCLVVVVPRLFDGLLGPEGQLPIGRAVWADTWVELPPEAPGQPWRNLLTDEATGAQAPGPATGLPLAQLFQTLPYALLRPDGPA
ncbi:MAG: malto-oligosyltrehalose synthase [Holophaga sp.]|nr:malto-oligosyltrehalose synthase [Holophaga sp.]